MTFPVFDPNYPQVGDECPLDAVAKAHVLLVLSRAEGYTDAARILGIRTSTLWRYRKKWGLIRPR
jgi:NtrC-family two-component system response regulator AlgB